jgi:hypothetical protein
VWTAIDPETKLLLSVQVGERTLAMAQTVLHHLAQLVALGCVPLFVSDGYPHYLTAIVTHCGSWVQPPRRQARGSAPKPRWMPLPALLYAQVVKTMRRRRRVAVKHRVVCGTQQAVAAVRRRSATPCKSAEGLGQQLALFHVYHNFVLPHTSLHQALAAGRTDHVWSL